MCDKVKKIALGSVQFGLDYGINNFEGIVNDEELRKIIQLAKEEGVDVIDTAKGYGTSEQRLGAVGISEFRLITKVTNSDLSEYEDSLSKLKLDEIAGVLMHGFKALDADLEGYKMLYDTFKGRNTKIGISIDKIEELEYVLDHQINFDIIQVAYNVLDQRFDAYFERLSNKGIEIHTRSTFLQGLFFMSDIPDYLKPLENNLTKLREISRNYNQSIESLALNFVISNPWIDKVVIGVNSETELIRNLEAVKVSYVMEELLSKMRDLAFNDERFILPMNWK